MIKTSITEMFGIKYPIICGAMFGLCKPVLCAAISNAGGMGNLTAATWETEKDFRGAIHETRKLTDKPFTVNITILPSFRITVEHYQMYLGVCAEEQVAAVEISGSPIDKFCGPEYIELLKKAGVKMFHKVGAVRHALHAQKAGYDGVYAAGIEEGGHPLNDDVTTMILTPRMKESLTIPVVATGGIATGNTMAAALMLGADAVMMASRFIATKECQCNDNIKQELVAREEHHTELICKSLNLQGRALVNKTVKSILSVEEKGGGLEELGPLLKGERCLKAYENGDVDHAALYVGQSIGLIHDIPTCEELLSKMVQEAEEQINKIQTQLQ